MICLLKNNLVSTIFWQFSQEANISWRLHLNNIDLILATRKLMVCTRHAGLKDILVWKHLVSFKNMRSFALMLWLIHMFVQGLMKVVGIGIATPRLWLDNGLKSRLQSFGVIVGFSLFKNSLYYLNEEILTSLRHTQWLIIWNQRFNVWGMTLV